MVVELSLELLHTTPDKEDLTEAVDRYLLCVISAIDSESLRTSKPLDEYHFPCQGGLYSSHGPILCNVSNLSFLAADTGVNWDLYTVTQLSNWGF